MCCLPQISGMQQVSLVGMRKYEFCRVCRGLLKGGLYWMEVFGETYSAVLHCFQDLLICSCSFRLTSWISLATNYFMRLSCIFYVTFERCGIEVRCLARVCGNNDHFHKPSQRIDRFVNLHTYLYATIHVRRLGDYYRPLWLR